MAQPWLHYECSGAVPRTLQTEVSGCSGRIDLAETLKLGTVVIALHALKCMDQGIEISPRKLTVLLPLHGAGVGSQRWRCAI